MPDPAAVPDLANLRREGEKKNHAVWRARTKEREKRPGNPSGQQTATQAQQAVTRPWINSCGTLCEVEQPDSRIVCVPTYVSKLAVPQFCVRDRGMPVLFLVSHHVPLLTLHAVKSRGGCGVITWLGSCQEMMDLDR